jgi:hypothetical protein
MNAAQIVAIFMNSMMPPGIGERYARVIDQSLFSSLMFNRSPNYSPAAMDTLI